MTKQQPLGDEELELAEFRQASSETEAIRALEEAEFIEGSDAEPADELDDESDSGERQQALTHSNQTLSCNG